MIIVKYKDPYERGGFEVELPDDTPQGVLDEVIAYIDNNTREVWASDRRERYHSRCSIDALEYEGLDYADPLTPDIVAERRENQEELEQYLSVLTDSQCRRARMRLDGMTYDEIAATEGVNVSSVKESILATRKKLKKRFPKFF